MTPSGPAAARWRDLLAAWVIPDDILAAAPRSPWGFSVAGFSDRVDRQLARPTPAHDLARDALPDAGTVLDLGCGAGAASRPLVPPAAVVTGVDESEAMLEAFVGVIGAAGARPRVVHGRWPDVAPRVDTHDVVVANDVVYNVADLGAFAVAAAAHAGRRVVLVLPPVHPMHWTAPYWRLLHGVERPAGPTVDDAVAVLAEVGITCDTTSWTEPTLWSFAGRDDAVDHLSQRLCVGEERGDELRAALDRVPPPREREAWALWWDPAGAA